MDKFPKEMDFDNKTRLPWTIVENGRIRSSTKSSRKNKISGAGSVSEERYLGM